MATDPSQERTGNCCPDGMRPLPLFFLDRKVIFMLNDVALLHVQCACDKLVLRGCTHFDLGLLWNRLISCNSMSTISRGGGYKRTFLSSSSFFIRRAVALV